MGIGASCCLICTHVVKWLRKRIFAKRDMQKVHREAGRVCLEHSKLKAVSLKTELPNLSYKYPEGQSACLSASLVNILVPLFIH